MTACDLTLCVPPRYTIGRMKRASEKRSKTKRTKSKAKRAAAFKSASKTVAHCLHCSKILKGDDQALFVEEELGRIFCSEACITAYFAPEIELLEKEYFARRPKNDLTPDEREKLSHLKWMTLQEPEEVWQEKTEIGDFRYTLIAPFDVSGERVWFICICLFLRGEPSFLYLGFPTKSESLVTKYRRGAEVVLETEANADGSASTEPTDGLGSGWTTDEFMRAEVSKKRRADDIPSEDFSQYQACFQETLEAPDEVLSMDSQVESRTRKVYHFIKAYRDRKPKIWYVVIARETQNEDQLEVLDAFPTRDSRLIEHLKVSNGQAAEMSESEMRNRVVH